MQTCTRFQMFFQNRCIIWTRLFAQIQIQVKTSKYKDKLKILKFKSINPKLKLCRYTKRVFGLNWINYLKLTELVGLWFTCKHGTSLKLIIRLSLEFVWRTAVYVSSPIGFWAENGENRHNFIFGFLRLLPPSAPWLCLKLSWSTWIKTWVWNDFLHLKDVRRRHPGP